MTQIKCERSTFSSNHCQVPSNEGTDVRASRCRSVSSSQCMCRSLSLDACLYVSVSTNTYILCHSNWSSLPPPLSLSPFLPLLVQPKRNALLPLFTNPLLVFVHNICPTNWRQTNKWSAHGMNIIAIKVSNKTSATPQRITPGNCHEILTGITP